MLIRRRRAVKPRAGPAWLGGRGAAAVRV